MADLRHLDGVKSTNRVAMINWNSILIVILASYLVNVLKKEHDWTYFFIIVALGYVPICIGFVMYKKNSRTQLIKYLISVSYTILYGFLLFTGNSDRTYVYIFPILVNILVFSDKRLLFGFSVMNTILNFVCIIYNWFIVKNTTLSTTDYAIQLFAVALVLWIAYFTSLVLEKVNKHSVIVITEEQEHTKAMLTEVVKSTNVIGDQITALNEEAITIADHASGSSTAIAEINTGTGDMVNSIQEQMEVSAKITSLVELTTGSSREIQQKFSKIRDNTSIGMQNMQELDQAAKDTKATNDTVDHTMHLLNEKTLEVRGIIEIINGITKQTHLLSLNAAIEAARAGESGRGFAVVADEISKLAADTQNATESINKILAELSSEAESAADAVSTLNMASIRQNELVKETKAKFTVIQSDISGMNTNITEQSENMEAIRQLNAKISQTIEFLSAFSEELMANTESTKELMEQTKGGCSAVSQGLTEITSEVSKLRELTSNQ